KRLRIDCLNYDAAWRNHVEKRLGVGLVGGDANSRRSFSNSERNALGRYDRHRRIETLPIEARVFYLVAACVQRGRIELKMLANDDGGVGGRDLQINRCAPRDDERPMPDRVPATSCKRNRASSL